MALPLEQDTGLAILCALVAAVLAVSSGAFLYYGVRGLGHHAAPFKQGFPPGNALGFLSTITTALVYMARAMEYADPGHGATFLGTIEYWDYAVTCPIIILDFCSTLGVPLGVLYTMCTALLLSLGALSYSTSGWVSATYFGIGSVAFSFFFAALLRDARRAVHEHLPAAAVRSAWAATGILVVFWPLFPLLWVFGRKGADAIDSRLNHVFHGLLDVVCKTVFGIVLTRCRLTLEDAALLTRVHSVDKIGERVSEAPAGLKASECGSGPMWTTATSSVASSTSSPRTPRRKFIRDSAIVAPAPQEQLLAVTPR